LPNPAKIFSALDINQLVKCVEYGAVGVFAEFLTTRIQKDKFSRGFYGPHETGLQRFYSAGKILPIKNFNSFSIL